MLDVDIAGQRGDFNYALSFKSDANVTALFGVSGAGKSTLIDAISGHVQPENGCIAIGDSVFFDTVNRKNINVRKRRVGHIFQDPRLFPHMNVKRNLTYARWAGWRNKKAASFDDIIEMLGLGDLLTRMPANLSGGERQRVAIGRALLSDPRVLLMDEPLTGLDHWRKMEIMPYFERIASEGGVPIVYVSHDLDEVVRLADHMVLMDAGRVKHHGALAEVLPKVHGQFDQGKHAPSSLIDAQFETIDPTWDMTWLKIGRQNFALSEKLKPRDEPYRVRIDASDVAIALKEPRGTSFQNVLHGRILAIEKMGDAYCDVTLSIDGQPIIARVTHKARNELSLAIDLPVFVMIKSVAIEGAR